MNTRLVRTQKALDRAIDNADDGHAAHRRADRDRVIDTAHGKLRDSLSRTIFTALDQRDAAVAYIHSIDVAAPPSDDLRARASGAPVGGTWATVMPPIADEVGDEIDQIDGALDLSSTMGVGIRRVLQDAELQAVKTQRTIDGYWPPLPADD